MTDKHLTQLWCFIHRKLNAKDLALTWCLETQNKLYDKQKDKKLGGDFKTSNWHD